MANRRARKAVPRTADWFDTAYTDRLHLNVTNTTSSPWHDHIVNFDTSTVSPAVTVDANSLKVVEKSALASVDRAYDWRYPLEANRFPVLPAYLSGSVVTFKSLGLWNAGETRFFEIYWTPASGFTPLPFTHLDAVAVAWIVALTAGTAGDSYVLVVGGQTYTYTMIGGDTATTIGAGLIALINAGAVATATNAAGTLSILTTTPRVFSFTVANTGSTTPANLVITAPQYFGVGRVGPETNNTSNWPLPATNINYRFNLGLAVTSAVNAQNYLGFGKGPGLDMLVRMMLYKVNSDAVSYYCNSGTITGITANGPNLVVTGTLTSTIAGSNTGRWSGAYTATFMHAFVSGALTSNATPAAGPLTKMKNVMVMRLQIVWTCTTGYAPTDVGSGNVGSSFILLSYADKNNSFAGNVTAVAPNTTTNFYATAGNGPTAYAINADLSAIAVPGTVIGSAGNTHASGLILKSITPGNGFPNGIAIQLFADSNAFVSVQCNGVSHTTTPIPTGATITIDSYMATSYTQNPSTSADSLLPSEVVTLLQNVDAVPSITYAHELLQSTTLNQTMVNVGSRLVSGIKWYQQNAASITGKFNNYTFTYQTRASNGVAQGTLGLADDNDGNYGEAHKLTGLCLRYLRTLDRSLLPLMALQARFHIDLERALVATWGNWWSGATSFWFAPITYTGNIEGGYGQPGSSVAQVDPAASTYGTLTDPVSAGIGHGGGVWRSTYNPATTYNQYDWVDYTDTGGANVGIPFWNQWLGPGTSVGLAPTDASGNSNSGWGNKNAHEYRITYTSGQPKASTSNDQAAMVCMAIYHYVYLLRNDPVVNSATPFTWRIGDVVAGSTGNLYKLVIGGTTITYTQASGDTAAIIASGLATAVNTAALAGADAAGVPATVAAQAVGTALYITNVFGLTVANTGTTVPTALPAKTLRQSLIDLLKRMADFQISVNPNGNTGPSKNVNAGVPTGQLYNLISGTNTYPAANNGITLSGGVYYSNLAGNSTLPMDTYAGSTLYPESATFGQWEILQNSGAIATSDANSGVNDMMRTIYAITANGYAVSQSVDQAATILYLTGRASDVMSLDLGRHAWTWGGAVSTHGDIAQAVYPPGWNMRSGASGNTVATQAAAPTAAHGPWSSDAHYISVNDGGVGDQSNGRSFQRMILLAFLALFNPNQNVLIEMSSTASPNATVVRQVPVTQLLDDMARTCTLYLMEPTTGAVRNAANAAQGTGSFNTWAIQPGFTGYALMALELWFLVQQKKAGNNLLPTYYHFPGV